MHGGCMVDSSDECSTRLGRSITLQEQCFWTGAGFNKATWTLIPDILSTKIPTVFVHSNYASPSLSLPNKYLIALVFFLRNRDSGRKLGLFTEECCPVVQWLVQRFRSERLRVRSRRSATFTPSAHVRRQSLPVWPPTLNNYLCLYL